jgi:hypothetical protein
MAWSNGFFRLAWFPYKKYGRLSMRDELKLLPWRYPQRSPPLRQISSVWMKLDSTLWEGI